MTVTMTVVDVGHGNATAVRSNGTTVLVDAGRKGALRYFLEDQGIKTLDLVLVSHSDRDHYGEATFLLAQPDLHIKQLAVLVDHTKTGPEWEMFRQAVDVARNRPNRPTQLRLVHAGDQFKVDGIQYDILAPDEGALFLGPGQTDDAGSKFTVNSLSMVVRVSAPGGTTVLLPGDLDASGLARALAEGQQLEADVLVFPHHGGGSGGDPIAFTDDLLGQVKPRVVLFSFSRKTANPIHGDIVRRIVSRHGAAVSCTQLATHCMPDEPSQEHVPALYASGRPGLACCAGSVQVELGDVASLVAGREHGAFVSTLPSAACR